MQQLQQKQLFKEGVGRLTQIKTFIMALLNLLVYRNEAGVNTHNPVATQFFDTHCVNGTALVPKQFEEIFIHWNVGTLAWVVDPVFVPGQSVVALKVVNECEALFSYLKLDQNFTTNDFRLLQLCCSSVPCVAPTILTVLPGFFPGVAYNQTLQITGTGDFDILVNRQPAWMNINLNVVTGLITFTGTPDGSPEELSFQFNNCNKSASDEAQQPATYTQTVPELFQVVQRADIPGDQSFSKSLWVPFLNKWICWVGFDDGSGFRIALSADGITWTKQATTFTQTIAAGAVGTDRIIFVGAQANAVMTVDGINFTTFALPQAIQHRGIAFSPSLNLFVIVAQQGANRIFTTVNGTSVNVVTAPVLNNWVSVTWSITLSLFVAVATSGSGNQIMTSPDGTTWTLRVSPGASRSWGVVRWLNNKFIALASTGTGGQRMMYSTDGINWTLLTLAQLNPSFSDIDFGNGLYVAIQSQPGADYWYRSLDGITWQSQDLPNDQWVAIKFNGISRFVATGIGGGGSGNSVATIDWF